MNDIKITINQDSTERKVELKCTTNLFDNLPIEIQEMILKKKEKIEAKPLMEYQAFIYKNDEHLNRWDIGGDFSPVCPHNAIYERMKIAKRICDSKYKFTRTPSVLTELIKLSTPELISYERNRFDARIPDDMPKTKKEMVEFYRTMGYKFVNLNRWKVGDMKEKIEERLNEWISELN